MTRIGKKQILRAALWLPFRLTFTEPILLFTDLYLGLVYAVLYCWFEAFPIAFIGVYGFTLGENGLSFLGILVGAFLTVGPYCYYMHKGEEKHIIKGALAPEKRLRPALVGAICMPISLFWFGKSMVSYCHISLLDPSNPSQAGRQEQAFTGSCPSSAAASSPSVLSFCSTRCSTTKEMLTQSKSRNYSRQRQS